jgi:CubicO group peptidase (beta-lactamase class C family)
MNAKKISATVYLMLLVLAVDGVFAQPVPAIKGIDNSWKDSARIQRIQAMFPVITRLFEAHAKSSNIPGLSFGIVVDGQLIHTGSFGYTDILKKIPATSKSVFRIASMSKSFACMAVLQLRDAGKLSLDDPAERFIPELSGLRYPTTDAPRITIRHLMTHGAGFPEDNPWGDRQLADTDKDLMELIQRQLSFSNAPGIAYEYSNLGFALLGKIISKVSGVPYQRYMQENIFRPLGMSHTTYEFAEVPADLLAHGYRWIYESWREEELLHDSPDGSWGAMGGMLSSVEDYARYMIAHLQAWPPSDETWTGPLGRGSIREMHHPWRFAGFNTNFTYPSGRLCVMASAYAYGLRWTRDCEGRTYIDHSGGLPGFGSQWRIMPEYGIGVVAFGNRTYSPMGAINFQVLDTLVRGAGLKPRPVAVSDILKKRQAELVKVIPNWKAAEQLPIFAENFFPDYPIDLLQKESTYLFGKVGPIVKVHPMIAENNLRGSFLIECERGNLEVSFTLSPENPALIQAYRIQQKNSLTK